ncbi:hypothetical protein IDAT_10455 [Pseudidiomarina atlantica]|uniref:SHOCT domain-containing protein n=1 Tax=Pseudidiomarina atlantica TaxID=1517416 RepID=A0A094IM42_9GAMM|nr:SHOCT domain-containing protein [Pseudidiomarina atlantica]KFZ28242.1 hypothetical protein IDAT_10455 [Pseudidiomarina atlantica]
MENFDEYQRLTEARNWRAISALNRVVHDTFGTRKEIEALADLANKWLRYREQSAAVPQNRVTSSDPIELLERLANLKAKGALSDEEFQRAKEKILAKF